MTDAKIVTPRLLQLYAIRAQLEAVIVAEEQEIAVTGPDPNGCPHCGAPEDKVSEIVTMDSRTHRRCMLCGEQWAA